MTAGPEPDHWKRLEALFFEALELDSAARQAFLEQSCAGDAALKQEVHSLLDSSDKTLQDLRQPVDEAAREIVHGGPAPGSRIGPYQLIRVLGEGGMGMVYLAARADEQYRQQVAIKVMQAGFGHRLDMLRRFRAERQILANLNHPNIARLLDGGITPRGSPYLVMELIDGVPIDEYGRTHSLPAAERLELFRTVCAAVEYAHRNLVVHRDIKPANILVTAEGTPKLLDFGIAKLVDPEKVGLTLAPTRPTDRLMTPEYASPEQVRGEAVTTATDVYALGVLLYELLTGRRPFAIQTTSPLEVARIICEQEPDRPSTVRRRHPELAPIEAHKLKGDLDNIVLKALRKEPARRYASVAQLSEDVRRHLEGYPVEARAGTWRYHAGKFIRRHRFGVALAGLMALAILGFGVGMALLAQRAARERMKAERESQFLASIFQAATPDAARGKVVTARQLLDAGAERIDRELAGDTTVQAVMLENVGRAYSALGVYDRAAALIRRAYDLRRRTLGDDNLEVAATLEGLATALRLGGEYQKADPLFRRSLAIRANAWGENNQLVAQSLGALGECLYLEGQNAQAEATLRKALAIFRRLDSDAGNATRNYLALVLERKGAPQEAAQLLREAVAADRRSQGADSTDYANSLHNLAGALIDLGDYAGAEAAERDDLALRRRILGNDHPDLNYALNNLGWLLLQKGDWKGAEPILRENLALGRRLLGEKHPRFSSGLSNWARLLQAKGDYLGAEKYYRQALRVSRETSGPESWRTAQILANLGLLELDRNNYAGAERFADQALAIRRKLGGEVNPDVASSLIEVAETREFQGDFAGAEPLLRQALEIRKKLLWPSHPDVIAAQVRLGEALTEEGKATEAEPLLRGAVASGESAQFPLLPWQIAEARNVLGACLAALGRLTEAETMLRQSQAALGSYPEAALRRRALRRVGAMTNRHDALRGRRRSLSGTATAT